MHKTSQDRYANSIMNKDNSSQSTKRHWWNNIADIYRVVHRSYSWIPWALAGIFLLCLLLGIGLAVWAHAGIFSYIVWIMFGAMLGVLLASTLLTQLAERAMYKQLDGVPGSAIAVFRQIRRGWVISEEPVAVNRKQDVIWRMVGRPGIVLISEGPSSRVTKMLDEEERTCKRIVMKVPVTKLQLGHGDGQVPLPQLRRAITKLPKAITKEEVPLVAQRLSSLRNKTMGMPKGIDPSKARINRRMLRGK